MTVFKLLGRLGHGVFTDRRTSQPTDYWTRFRNTQEHMRHFAATHPHMPNLNLAHLHERNGTRGEGMGLGRQQAHHHTPKKK